MKNILIICIAAIALSASACRNCTRTEEHYWKYSKMVDSVWTQFKDTTFYKESPCDCVDEVDPDDLVNLDGQFVRIYKRKTCRG